MKTITLTNWERFWLAIIIGSGQGTIAQIRLGSKALDVLEMKDKEKAEVGWAAFPDRGQVSWQCERDWELEFADDVWPIIQGYTKAFQRWPQDRQSEVLYDRIVEEKNE